MRMQDFWIAAWSRISDGVWPALLFSFFTTIFYCIQTKRSGKNKVWVSLLTFYLYLLLNAVIFSRPYFAEPLDHVWQGWKVACHNGEWYYDPIYNIVMFMPAVILLFQAFPDTAHDQPVRYATLYSLLFSLLIETTQIVTYTGTFQVSDLVYNTISGMAGGMIWKKCINS